MRFLLILFVLALLASPSNTERISDPASSSALENLHSHMKSIVETAYQSTVDASSYITRRLTEKPSVFSFFCIFYCRCRQLNQVVKNQTNGLRDFQRLA